MKVKSESEVAQSCPTLSDPMDCSLPGSSIHGIFQAGVLTLLPKNSTSGTYPRDGKTYMHKNSKPFCCCSVLKSCPTLRDPMDCSTPGFPVLHYLPKFAQINSCPLSPWCHPTISSSAALFSFCLQFFPASGSFQMSWLFTPVGQGVGASSSASVLSMNIQGWFPLGLTGLISLRSKCLLYLMINVSVGL